MKIGQIGPTFSVPWKIVNLFGVKTVVPSSTLKMRKSHEKLGLTNRQKECLDDDIWTLTDMKSRECKVLLSPSLQVEHLSEAEGLPT